MNEPPRGTIKTFVESLSIRDNNISNILKRNLTLEGYDLVINPLRESNYQVGETIEIYRIDTPIERIEPIRR